MFTVTGDGDYSNVSAKVTYSINDTDNLEFIIENTSDVASSITAFAFSSEANITRLSDSPNQWKFFQNFEINADERGSFDYGAGTGQQTWEGGRKNFGLGKDQSAAFIFDIKDITGFSETNILNLNENGNLFVVRFQGIEGFGENDSTTAAYVPIPGAAWLFGSGLLGLLVLRRRKQAKVLPE